MTCFGHVKEPRRTHLHGHVLLPLPRQVWLLLLSQVVQVDAAHRPGVRGAVDGCLVWPHADAACRAIPLLTLRPTGVEALS